MASSVARSFLRNLVLVVLSTGLAAAVLADEAAPSPAVNVKQKGAVGDGVADDTAALQSALDGGRRTVLIPAGTYKIGRALLLDSGTTIQADPHAVIRLADHAGNDAGLFLLANRDVTGGNTDIAVNGGIWDGNNEHNARGRPDQMPCYSGVAINFIHVQRLALRNLTVRNPDAYAIRACRIEDFVIENIGFDFSITRPNQDGVHLDGFCQRGVIRHLRALSPFATNDDMVALNADDGSAADYVMQQGMQPGPIRDIVVEDLRAESAFTFVRLLSHRELIENITISGISGGCRFYAINMDRWRFPEGGGNIHHVLLQNISVRKMPDVFSTQKAPAQRPLIHIQTAVDGLRIENFHRAADDVPAATLVLDNGRENKVRLEGITTVQARELAELSPGVTDFMFSGSASLRDGGYDIFGTWAKLKLTLPRGGFSLLTVDARRPADAAASGDTK